MYSSKVFLKSGKLCCLGDIIVEHVNFYKVVLDSRRIIASRSPLITIHLVERLDKLDPLKTDSLEVDVETALQIFRDRYYNIY